jgi:hypothetical protein
VAQQSAKVARIGVLGLVSASSHAPASRRCARGWAKAIGLTLPTSIVLRGDEVIE